MDLNKCRDILLEAIKDGNDGKVEELAKEIGQPVEDVRKALNSLNNMISLKARQLRVSRRSIIRAIKSKKVFK